MWMNRFRNIFLFCMTPPFKRKITHAFSLCGDISKFAIFPYGDLARGVFL